MSLLGVVAVLKTLLRKPFSPPSKEAGVPLLVVQDGGVKFRPRWRSARMASSWPAEGAAAGLLSSASVQVAWSHRVRGESHPEVGGPALSVRHPALNDPQGLHTLGALEGPTRPPYEPPEMRQLLPLLLLCFLFLPVQAQEEARTLVDKFYQSYQKAESWSKFLPGQKDTISNELYELLNACVDNGPDDGFWLDFDPFLNAQMNAATIKVGEPKSKQGLWYVPVEMSYRAPGHLQPALTVVVGDTDVKGQMKIMNFVYPARDGAPSWDLKSFLKKGLGK